MKKLGLFMSAFAVAVLMAGGMALAAAHDEEDDDNKFSVHGEIRFRMENWSNLFDFTDSDVDSSSPAFDDNFDFFPYRYSLMAKGDLGNDIWVGAEFQGTGVAGGGLSGEQNLFFGDAVELTESGTMVYQGWVKLVDIGNTQMDLKIGRQEIKFDRGLHFSNLAFYNGISHDGIMAAWDYENFAIHGFWIRNSESNLSGVILGGGCANSTPDFPSFLCTADDADQDTFGVHFKHYIEGNENHDVAYYAFLQNQNDTDLDAGDDKGRIYTLGGRWGRYMAEDGGFSWNLELALQSGDYQPIVDITDIGSLTFLDFADDNCDGVDPGEACSQSAYVFEGSGGYTWNGDGLDQTLWGGLTYASGDDDPDDDDQEAYVPLFTDFHKRLGYADQWALSNIQALSAGYKVNANDKHLFGATIYQFEKAEDEGVSFSPLTGVFVDCPPTESCDNDLGLELDLFYNYIVSNNFSFDVAWSILDPGQAVEDHFSGFGTAVPDGQGEDTGWRLTAQARARF